MIRPNITRTLATSTIHACKLVMNEETPTVITLDPLTVGGKVSEREALKALKDVYGKDSALTVTKITVEENLYSISVEDFLKYATKVEKDKPAESTEPAENQ